MDKKETANTEKLALIAVKTFKANDEMYKVVDFLNKTLKGKRVIFGLTKDTLKNSMNISIYET